MIGNYAQQTMHLTTYSLGLYVLIHSANQREDSLTSLCPDAVSGQS